MFFRLACGLVPGALQEGALAQIAKIPEMAGTAHASLQRERAQASFPVRELTFYLDGGKATTLARERFERLLHQQCLKQGSGRPLR